ncbi:MAG TPA: D-2-hydroxyacid dehydrogenase family protein [Vicinamibacterales bacterium]|nr:D-2-hydroxyacid dehydrogenase family protein [Vicinamibacterales bacterium]
MNKLCCAVLDDYQQVALASADWRALSDALDVRVLHRHAGEDELVSLISDCEIVVLMRERTPFTRSLIARLPALKLIVTSGMRNAAIDLEAARERGVTVCGTASRAEPPAELTWSLILALARHVTQEAAAFRANGPWQSTIGVDLHGRTLGVLGLGNIGSRVARVGVAFGMRVLAWSENLTPDRARAAGAELVPSKRDLLEQSDVVSIHLVLSARTRGLLAADDLRRMKPTAYLVNTSRAPIVDGDALVRALREGWIAGAGLDVFEEEPPAADDPLRSLPNVLATPHLGYVSRDNYRTYYGEAVEDIAAFLKGTPIRMLL